MTAVTLLASKEITSLQGWKLYKIDEAQDADTLVVPFGKVWAVFIQVIETGTPQYASYTVSGSTITFELSANDVDLDVLVIGE